MGSTQHKGGLRHQSRTLYHAYVRRPALRLCTDILQRVPISSERFGPPKGIVASTREWIEAGPPASVHSRFIPVHAPERLTFRPLHTVESEADFHQFYAEGLDSPLLRQDEAGTWYTDLPGTFVAEIPEGRAYGCDGAVITPSDHLLGDLSPEYTASRYIAGKHSVLAQMHLPKAHYVPGSVAVLASLGAQEYFAHWMMDMLPRIGLLEEAGFPLDSIDKFYVNSPNLEYQKLSLEALGVPMSKVIDSRTHPHIKAECLIAPSPVSGAFASSSETCEFLRRRFLEAANSNSNECPRRLYISRASAKHRRVTNENEVIQMLVKYGFVALKTEDLSFAEKSQAFSQAEAVVMPCGSAMANTVYCESGAKIIEILNPRAVQVCTWAICSQRNAEYYFMFAQGVDKNDGVLSEDLSVDIEKLIQTLNLAGIKPA